MIPLDTHSHSTLLSNDFSLGLSELNCKITFEKWVVFGKGERIARAFSKRFKICFPLQPRLLLHAVKKHYEVQDKKVYFEPVASRWLSNRNY